MYVQYKHTFEQSLSLSLSLALSLSLLSLSLSVSCSLALSLSLSLSLLLSLSRLHKPLRLGYEQLSVSLLCSASSPVHSSSSLVVSLCLCQASTRSSLRIPSNHRSNQSQDRSLLSSLLYSSLVFFFVPFLSIMSAADMTVIKGALMIAGMSKFDGNAVGFIVWQQHMEGVFMTAGLAPIIRNGNDPSIPALTATQLSWVKSIIMAGLTTTIAAQYTNYISGMEIWDLLQSTYNSRTPFAIGLVRAEYNDMKYVDDGSVTISMWCETVRGKIAQLASLGVVVTEDGKIDHFFQSLPAEYYTVREACELHQITNFNIYVSRVKDYSLSRKRKEESHAATSSRTPPPIATPSPSSYPPMYGYGTANRSRGGFANRCSSTRGGANVARTNSTCYNCRAVGHMSFECTKPKNMRCSFCHRDGHVYEQCHTRRNSGRPQQQQQQDIVQSVTDNVIAAINRNIASASTSAHANINQAHSSTDYKVTTPNTTPWRALLDSGATRHLITDASLISNMCPLSSPISMMVANKQEVTMRHGGLMVVATSGHPVVLDVVYAPSFKENLISVGQLTRDGVSVVMTDKSAIISFGVDTIVAPKLGNLFVIQQHRSPSQQQHHQPSRASVFSVSPVSLVSSVSPGVEPVVGPHPPTPADVSPVQYHDSHLSHTGFAAPASLQHTQPTQTQAQTQHHTLRLHLFHARMGHISAATATLLRDAVTGVDDALSSVAALPSACACLPCSRAKATRTRFASATSAPAVTSPLHMVVPDLCGPI